MTEHIDPRRIFVHSQSAPSWSQPESFQDIMADQLRRAPWLAISVAVHALAVLILLQIPASQDQERAPELSLSMDREEEKVEPDEPPPDPPEKPEVIDPDVPEMQTVDPVVAEQAEDSEEQYELEAPTDDFDLSESIDTPIGIGAGNLGIRNGRGGGRGRLGRTGRPIAKSIHVGLQWLAKHQDPNGSWSSSEFMKHCPANDVCDGAGNPVNDIGLTGLALLAFLGDGSTLRHGEYRDVVKRATIWLKEQQDDNGLFGVESGRQFMYNHAIAALAFVESYGLSKYRSIRRHAQRAVDYVCRARNPYKVWRYYPHDGSNDTSVTGWMVFVLKSAKDFELRVDSDALTYSLAWFDEVTDPATGQCGYQKRGELSSRELELTERFPANKTEAMTATGLLCRIFLKDEQQRKQGLLPIERAAADLMLKKPPVWNESDGSIDMYYWYYATYAMFQAGGKHWKSWRKHMEASLLKGQSVRGHSLGSWKPVGAWGHAGGRVYATAIGVLCLEVYYRYSQLIR